MKKTFMTVLEFKFLHRFLVIEILVSSYCQGLIFVLATLSH